MLHSACRPVFREKDKGTRDCFPPTDSHRRAGLPGLWFDHFQSSTPSFHEPPTLSSSPLLRMDKLQPRRRKLDPWLRLMIVLICPMASTSRWQTDSWGLGRRIGSVHPLSDSYNGSYRTLWTYVHSMNHGRLPCFEQGDQLAGFELCTSSTHRPLPKILLDIYSRFCFCFWSWVFRSGLPNVNAGQSALGLKI
ncbi:hypothetical protein CC2G_013249 [Coprinopsis cinerea AmutBmut pab1-1]|nr:hypothetical protein CC2G_013249 [Coprinopsis cinerea AmutBmut pab1-1]